MITVVGVLSAAMLLASPASAKPDHRPKAKDTAAKACAAAEKADQAAFEALYGKHAMRNCVKAQAQECKAEQAADPAAFEEAYGDDDPYTTDTAFGKCVSAKVRESDEEETPTS